MFPGALGSCSLSKRPSHNQECGTSEHASASDESGVRDSVRCRTSTELSALVGSLGVATGREADNMNTVRMEEAKWKASENVEFVKTLEFNLLLDLYYKIRSESFRQSVAG